MAVPKIKRGGGRGRKRRTLSAATRAKISLGLARALGPTRGLDPYEAVGDKPGTGKTTKAAKKATPAKPKAPATKGGDSIKKPPTPPKAPSAAGAADDGGKKKRPKMATSKAVKKSPREDTRNRPANAVTGGGHQASKDFLLPESIRKEKGYDDDLKKLRNLLASGDISPAEFLAKYKTKSEAARNDRGMDPEGGGFGRNRAAQREEIRLRTMGQDLGLIDKNGAPKSADKPRGNRPDSPSEAPTAEFPPQQRKNSPQDGPQLANAPEADTRLTAREQRNQAPEVNSVGTTRPGRERSALTLKGLEAARRERDKAVKLHERNVSQHPGMDHTATLKRIHAAEREELKARRDHELARTPATPDNPRDVPDFKAEMAHLKNEHYRQRVQENHRREQAIKRGHGARGSARPAMAGRVGRDQRPGPAYTPNSPVDPTAGTRESNPFGLPERVPAEAPAILDAPEASRVPSSVVNDPNRGDIPAAPDAPATAVTETPGNLNTPAPTLADLPAAPDAVVQAQSNLAAARGPRRPQSNPTAADLPDTPALPDLPARLQLAPLNETVDERTARRNKLATWDDDEIATHVKAISDKWGDNLTNANYDPDGTDGVTLARDRNRYQLLSAELADRDADLKAKPKRTSARRDHTDDDNAYGLAGLADMDKRNADDTATAAVDNTTPGSIDETPEQHAQRRAFYADRDDELIDNEIATLRNEWGDALDDPDHLTDNLADQDRFNQAAIDYHGAMRERSDREADKAQAPAPTGRRVPASTDLPDAYDGDNLADLERRRVDDEATAAGTIDEPDLIAAADRAADGADFSDPEAFVDPEFEALEKLESNPNLPDAARKAISDQLDHMDPWREGGDVDRMLPTATLPQVRAKLRALGDQSDDDTIRDQMAMAGSDRADIWGKSYAWQQSFEDWQAAHMRIDDSTEVGTDLREDVGGSKHGFQGGVQTPQKAATLPEEIRGRFWDLGFLPNEANYRRELRGEEKVPYGEDTLRERAQMGGKAQRRSQAEINRERDKKARLAAMTPEQRKAEKDRKRAEYEAGEAAFRERQATKKAKAHAPEVAPTLPEKPATAVDPEKSKANARALAEKKASRRTRETAEHEKRVAAVREKAKARRAEKEKAATAAKPAEKPAEAKAPATPETAVDKARKTLLDPTSTDAQRKKAGETIAAAMDKARTAGSKTKPAGKTHTKVMAKKDEKDVAARQEQLADNIAATSDEERAAAIADIDAKVAKVKDEQLEAHLKSALASAEKNASQPKHDGPIMGGGTYIRQQREIDQLRTRLGKPLGDEVFPGARKSPKKSTPAEKPATKVATKAPAAKKPAAAKKAPAAKEAPADKPAKADAEKEVSNLLDNRDHSQTFRNMPSEKSQDDMKQRIANGWDADVVYEVEDGRLYVTDQNGNYGPVNGNTKYDDEFTHAQIDRLAKKHETMGRTVGLFIHPNSPNIANKNWGARSNELGKALRERREAGHKKMEARRNSKPATKVPAAEKPATYREPANAEERELLEIVNTRLDTGDKEGRAERREAQARARELGLDPNPKAPVAARKPADTSRKGDGSPVVAKTRPGRTAVHFEDLVGERRHMNVNDLDAVRTWAKDLDDKDLVTAYGEAREDYNNAAGGFRVAGVRNAYGDELEARRLVRYNSSGSRTYPKGTPTVAKWGQGPEKFDIPRATKGDKDAAKRVDEYASNYANVLTRQGMSKADADAQVRKERDSIEKPAAEKSVATKPTEAGSPQTFKQYVDAKHRDIARKNGLTLAEVREGDPAERHNRDYRDYLVKAFNDGQDIPTQQWNTLDEDLQRRILRTPRALKDDALTSKYLNMTRKNKDKGHPFGLSDKDMDLAKRIYEDTSDENNTVRGSNYNDLDRLANLDWEKAKDRHLRTAIVRAQHELDERGKRIKWYEGAGDKAMADKARNSRPVAPSDLTDANVKSMDDYDLVETHKALTKGQRNNPKDATIKADKARVAAELRNRGFKVNALNKGRQQQDKPAAGDAGAPKATPAAEDGPFKDVSNQQLLRQYWSAQQENKDILAHEPDQVGTPKQVKLIEQMDRTAEVIRERGLWKQGKNRPWDATEYHNNLLDVDAGRGVPDVVDPRDAEVMAGQIDARMVREWEEHQAKPHNGIPQNDRDRKWHAKEKKLAPKLVERKLARPDPQEGGWKLTPKGARVRDAGEVDTRPDGSAVKVDGDRYVASLPDGSIAAVTTGREAADAAIDRPADTRVVGNIDDMKLDGNSGLGNKPTAPAADADHIVDNPDADIVIEHTPEGGTIVHGTSRGDGTADILKANGFRWSRNLGAWYIQRSKDQRPNRQKINTARKALADAGHNVGIDLDTSRRSAAEREAAKTEQANARAAALADKADRKAAAADAATMRAYNAGQALPEGAEPIKVGHHSEKRHRRAIDRAHSTMDKAVAADREAAEVAERARIAASANDRRNNPTTVANRIDKLGTEIRGLERDLNGYRGSAPATGARKERLEQRIAEVQDDLEFQQGIRAEQVKSGAIKDITRDTLNVGDLVKVEDRHWGRVVKANPKTVEVDLGGQFSLKYRYNQLTDHKVDEKGQAELKEASQAAAEQRDSDGNIAHAPGSRILKKHLAEGETFSRGKIVRHGFTIQNTGDDWRSYTIVDPEGRKHSTGYSNPSLVRVRSQVDRMKADYDLIGKPHPMAGQSDDDLGRIAREAYGERQEQAKELLGARQAAASKPATPKVAKGAPKLETATQAPKGSQRATEVTAAEIYKQFPGLQVMDRGMLLMVANGNSDKAEAAKKLLALRS